MSSSASPVRITLPDGSAREIARSTSVSEIAKSIGKRLEASALAGKLDGKLVDLYRPVEADAKIEIITRESREGLDILRHSTAHLLAHAIKELYPTAQITIGPVTAEGFYYDIDCPVQLTPDDLPKIEKKMEEVAARNLPVERSMKSKAEAADFFRKQGEFYKAEIIEGIPEPTVSLYTQGNFTDLCRGPHVPNTNRLGKFKLLSIAGAYWRGDEKNKMLQRIYGTAFATQKELDEHLRLLDEAKKRDHRHLGPELGLFKFLPVAPAMPFFLPKGALLLNALTTFMREEMRRGGYQEVICPQLMTGELWTTSGHMQNYKENMFLTQSGDDEKLMCLKPMNCPGHCALFASTKHSYRELPLRYAEFSRLHRNERAGVTHGLFRVRSFSQDDAHIFCTEDQVGSESKGFIESLYRVYKALGFENFVVKLATRPDNFIGEISAWDRAEATLGESLKACGIPFEIAAGEGAFYGPKIEFHIRDSLNRLWQCGTLQLDNNFPERFDLTYTAADGQPKRPVMLHRAILGSFERFFGIFVEHHGGHFPFWIAPQQAVVISVNEAQNPYAKEIGEWMAAQGYRVETDLRNEKLGYKIREAQLQRIPLMVVLGNRELEQRTVTVRKVSGENFEGMNLDAFRDFLRDLPGGLVKPGGTNH